MEKLIPKCKDNKMRFMGADGKIYPCCFIYTQKEESFDPWIKKIKEDDSQLDYRNHTLDEILNSNIFKKLKETFDNFEKCLKPCKKNCGSIQGFKSTAKGNPKTEKFEKKIGKMDKKILAGGCSFTTDGIYDFKVWPDFLGEKLNKKVVNLGKGGKGNGNIAQKLFDYILKNHHEIDSVFVLWTDFWRHDIYNHEFVSTPWQSMLLDDASVPNDMNDFIMERQVCQSIVGKSGEGIKAPRPGELDKTRQIGDDFFPLKELNEHLRHQHFDSALYLLKSWEYSAKRKSAKSIIETLYNNNFYHIKTVELLCQSLNIPYTAWCAMSQCGKGLHFSWMGNNLSMGQSIKRSIPIIDKIFDEAENYLNIKNYIKWPWKFWMNNDVESQFRLLEDGKNIKIETYRVSNIDNHPNEKAHEIICEKFFEKYVENNFQSTPEYIYE